MAQVMVNFRLDENIKKSMEQACREMGLSMTTAFTIFATKVGREKRIPFEVTAQSPEPPRPAEPAPEESPLARRQARLEGLCAAIRRSLTALYSAIPDAITGLSMERIRLLCRDELKDKTAAAAAGALFSPRNAPALLEKDLALLDEYLDQLAAIAGEVEAIARTLIPQMKSWSGGDTSRFQFYEQRLEAVSRAFDAIQPQLERFLASSACRPGSAQAVLARIRHAAENVAAADVLSALGDLESLVLLRYGGLDGAARARLEAYYLPALEQSLQELGRAEDAEEGAKAQLCLRAVNVLSQVISGNGRAQRELRGRTLEAEITALERFAAMRGDIES